MLCGRSGGRGAWCGEDHLSEWEVQTHLAVLHLEGERKHRPPSPSQESPLPSWVLCCCSAFLLSGAEAGARGSD